MCYNFTGQRICDDETWEMACLALNILSIIVNVLHLVILGRMSSLKGKNYLKLLNHIGVVDILSSVSLMVQTNCQLHHLTLEGSRTLGASISIVTNVAPTFRYYLFALGSCDRYMAICKPMMYRQSQVYRHFDWWLALGWVISFIFISVRDIVFSAELCVNSVLGASNYAGTTPSSLSSSFLMIFTILSTGLQIRIGIEMYRMRKQNLIPNHSQVIKATLYILVIYVEFVLCLCPVLLCLLLAFVQKCGFFSVWISSTAFSLYGTINSVTYGWINQSYRIEVRRMLGYKPTRTVSQATPS